MYLSTKYVHTYVPPTSVHTCIGIIRYIVPTYIGVRYVVCTYMHRY